MDASIPKVSVIVPNYNYSRYLPERLDSILAQTYGDYEILILDDASTDDSIRVIDRYRDNPKVSRVVINEKNTGSPFIQWARGINMARGEYIWIAEADDVAEPAFLEETVRVLDSDPDISLAMSMSNIVDSDGNLMKPLHFELFDETGRSEVFDGREFVRSCMFGVNLCYNASMALFRKRDFERLTDNTYARMKYCGDWLLWSQLMLNHKVGVVRSRLNRFRKHGRSVTDSAVRASGVEVEIVRVREFIMSTTDDYSYDRLTYLKYSISRALRRLISLDSPTPAQLDAINEMEALSSKYRIGSGSFPWHWIYKHWFHSLPLIGDKARIPRVLATVER